MSRSPGIYLHGVEIFHWHDSVDPTFLFLFTNEEVRRWQNNSEDDEYAPGKYLPREKVQLTATAAVLRDRLQVLGIGRRALNEVFSVEAGIKLANLRSIDPSVYPDAGNTAPEIELLDGATLADWVDLLAEALKAPDKRAGNIWVDPTPTSLESLLEIWMFVDPRFLLGAVLLACEPNDEIAIDISTIREIDWMDGGFDPQLLAIEHFGYSLTNGTPPVIITEGSTDARFLQEAIRIRYPHLRSFIRFLDFADGAEGSAAAGVRTLKSFAAAGTQTGSYCFSTMTRPRVTQYGHSEVSSCQITTACCTTQTLKLLVTIQR